MNPPFNANIQNLDDKCPKIKKTNMDATKGLYFVYYIADIVQKGYLATILPLPCAIGNGNHIFMYKRKILDNNSLIACFTLPSDLFYPNSSVNTCIMLFKLGLPHRNYDKETFFAYCKDDGFIKRKNQGRIEKDD